MPATTTKGVRLTPKELERVNRLRAFYPEASSESELIKLATVRGLLLLEAEVAASGGGISTGMTEGDLASVILPRILPALTWLSRLGRLPHLLAAPITHSNSVTGDRIEPEDAHDELDLSAAGDIGELGGDFL